MGRYADVVTEANKIVSATAPFASAIGVKHTLAPTASEVFKTPYTHVERIFSFPFTDLDLPGTQKIVYQIHSEYSELAFPFPC